MLVLNTPRNDMCYCPGCSHGQVLERLAEAMQRLDLPPQRVCLVSDIGCIGTADRYFECHTFHGLHGRSFTYAEGVKRARPELTVVVLVGDGGCGIGTAHLVHSARRNAGIKVLVCNNFNFGMTGGQHSPTTPPAGVTTTTPSGSDLRPFDICRTVMASSAGYIARGSAFDAHATDMITDALRTPGFALVDVWELCTAYYVTSNKLNPTALLELSQQLGMPFGVLQKPDVPAAPVVGAPAGMDTAARTAATPQPPRSETTREAERDEGPAVSIPWPTRREICVAGSAGQRIRSAAGLLGEMAVAAGLHAAQQDDFPITVRKGHSISNLIVAPEAILYTGLDEPDLLVVLSDDGLRRLGALSALRPECVVVSDASLVLPEAASQVLRVTRDGFGRDADRATYALAALAFGVVAAGWLTAEALMAAAEITFQGRYRDVNLRALRAGALHFAAARPRPYAVFPAEGASA